MCGRPQVGEAGEGLPGQADHFLVEADSPRNPRAAFAVNDRELELGERIHPQFPYSRKMLFRADQHGVIDVCQDVDFYLAEKGKRLDFCSEIIDGILKQEAEESCGKTFPLKHSINNLEGLVVHVPNRHV